MLLPAVLAVFLLGFLGFAIFNDNPLGGEPMARVAINTGSPAEAPAKAPHRWPRRRRPPPISRRSSGKPPPPAEQRTVTIIDGSSGARKDFKVPGSGAGRRASGTAAERATRPTHDRHQSAAARSLALRQIPIAADGLKPSSVYAGGNEIIRARASTMPAIAIVIHGLGVGAAQDQRRDRETAGRGDAGLHALWRRPGQAGRAGTDAGTRGAAADADGAVRLSRQRPGPQTLLTNANAEQNIDRLHWHLSRFQGYAGLANFMGSRFVATDAAMQPVIREAAKRGLAYFDDGTAPRSLAGQIAQSQAVPFAKADLTIDVVPTAAEIDRALAQLEAVARQRGAAVGIASALPISIDRIAAWTKVLEGRGILLVPLTTAMQKSKSS